MPLVKLQFSPGVNKEGTDYTPAAAAGGARQGKAAGGWYDTDKVRFRMGVPEKIGGWLKRTTGTFIGTCRALLPWTALSSVEYIGIGTQKKLYIEDGGLPQDITPIRASSTINSNPFAVTNGSAVVIVTDTSHGAVEGDYVTFSGATTTGGILAATLNAEQLIDSITDSNTYKFTAATSATSSTSGGGASVVAAYQINIGLDGAIVGAGWGYDPWGDGNWGEAGSGLVTSTLRLWSLTTFGEDLIANVHNGGLYYWDTSSGTGTRAVNLTSLAGAADVPEVCRRIVVAAESRHLLALGCNPIGSGAQDTLLIRWPDAETLIDWTPDTENSAGSLRLSTGSEIITGLATKRDTLVWTDISLNSVTYTGSPFFFGTRLLATNVSIISPNAAIQADDVTYWMGWEQFYIYDGSVKTLPCSLRSYVFDNINREQVQKVFVGLNRGDSEVIWFYPTTGAEIDSYVVFNYGQNIWYHGTMVRTAWYDRTFTEYPIAAHTDGYLYHHELGCDDGSTTPFSAISAHAESGLFEIFPGDGYQFAFVRRLIPDVTFSGSDGDSPAVSITVTPRDFPGDSLGTSDASTVTRSATTPVETFTKQAHVRLRGRAIKYKIESTAVGTFWRDGEPRIEARMDGRR